MSKQVLLIDKEDLEFTLHEIVTKAISKIQPGESYKDSKPKKLSAAAEYCGMPEPTFRAYLSKGLITGSKIGKSWRFFEKDLNDFINKYRKENKDFDPNNIKIKKG